MEFNQRVLILKGLKLSLSTINIGNDLINKLTNNRVLFVLSLELIQSSDSLIELINAQICYLESVDNAVLKTIDLTHLLKSGIKNWSLINNTESQSKTFKNILDDVL